MKYKLFLTFYRGKNLIYKHIQKCCKTFLYLGKKINYIYEDVNDELKKFNFEKVGDDFLKKFDKNFEIFLNEFEKNNEKYMKKHDSFYYFSFLNYKKFSEYSKIFPKDLFAKLIVDFPIFRKNKLESELKFFWKQKQIHHEDLNEMARLFFESGFSYYLEEIEKLIHLILTIPLTSAKAERTFSQLKLVQSGKRTNQTQKRLNELCFLSIEREFLSEIVKDDSFYEKVYQKFLE